MAGTLTAGLVAAGAAIAVQASAAEPSPSPQVARANAARSASTYVASRPAALHATADDQFIQHPVISSGGVQYVPYDRTYKGLAVVGGDFVLVTNSLGKTMFTSVAQQQSIGSLATTPTLSQAAAEAVARGRQTATTAVEGTRLVVYALGSAPKLAWETTVVGSDAEGPSRLTVEVDATTGAVLDTLERVMHGDGDTAWNGPKPVHLETTGSGGSFSMKDPVVTNLSCGDYSGGATFTGPDDKWGNGDATSRETGCADALYSAQTEVKMLRDWLGRNAMDGNGGAWPIRVGLPQQNAYYNGSIVAIGRNTKNQWISSLDVVGHEMGHGIDDHTPGGISRSGTQEFVADTFGAMTEWYANEPAPFDVPDFTVGEAINLVGSGPIRNMWDPSKLNHSNCYSSSVPGQEVHAAAGPGNHWFYLMAMGSNPTNGQPVSPTCNGSTVTGIGIEKAAKVMYNAMLMKTSSSSYLKYRTWTLQAAKNVFPNSCAEFKSVKAAWDAISVPAQSDEPTCTGGGDPTPTPTPTGGPGNCSGQKLANAGFESGATGWTASTGVIAQRGTAQPAHGGTWTALLGGHGTTRTDTLSQSVAIPAGCKASLSFWLHIDTRETTKTIQYDKLTVQAGSTTLATFSNLNAAAGYVQKTYDVSALAGQTVTVKFTGTEDFSLQTSFVVDDTALTLS